MEWYVTQDGGYTAVDAQARFGRLLRRSQGLAAANRQHIARIRLMLELVSKPRRIHRHLHRAGPLSSIH